jgi:hypothetical protein
MTHTSWRYRRRRNRQQEREFREAQRERVRRRWAKVHGSSAAEPARRSHVVEVTIRSTHATMRTIRLQREPRGEVGWSRWDVIENGHRIGGRRFGSGTIARLLARSLI